MSPVLQTPITSVPFSENGFEDSFSTLSLQMLPSNLSFSVLRYLAESCL